MTYPGRNVELVSAACAGDEAALDRLVAECLPHVVNWCARLGGGRLDAEDAAHDALVVVITRLPTLRTPETFPYWLFGVVRNVIRSHRRRGFIKRWIPGPVPDIADGGPGVGRQAEMSEAARQVDTILQQMPAKQREALVLCDLEERSASEVGRLLGVPTGTVKSRIRLARASFLRIAAELSIAPDLVEAT
ncbi:MAG: RNA polymerase sigma factor [Proteobacteria bacterium]|nr:RNA polymerase sigma factor [Pseudomonadota bacterium]